MRGLLCHDPTHTKCSLAFAILPVDLILLPPTPTPDHEFGSGQQTNKYDLSLGTLSALIRTHAYLSIYRVKIRPFREGPASKGTLLALKYLQSTLSLCTCSSHPARVITIVLSVPNSMQSLRVACFFELRSAISRSDIYSVSMLNTGIDG